MIHKKEFYSTELVTTKGTLIIEGPVQPDTLASYYFDENLTSFREPKKQQKALVEISSLEEGRIIVARENERVVGYVTFHYPDELERWSEGNMENLIELGAVEVIPEFRGQQVGKHLLRLSMLDDAMEDYIIITTEYYWHWDLRGTGLDVWGYRKVMEKMMNAGGLEWFATDDPEICSHPANCLMVRIGKRITHEDIQRFDRIRFKNRYLY